MTLTEYKAECGRTLAPLEPREQNLHMVLGMVTEVGELADVVKRKLAYGKAEDFTNVKEEIGDLMWYVVNFCNLHGFDLEEILGTNIAKLKARFPDKFTSEKALTRDLEAERKILEDGTTGD